MLFLLILYTVHDYISIFTYTHCRQSINVAANLIGCRSSSPKLPADPPECRDQIVRPQSWPWLRLTSPSPQCPVRSTRSGLLHARSIFRTCSARVSVLLVPADPLPLPPFEVTRVLLPTCRRTTSPRLGRWHSRLPRRSRCRHLQVAWTMSSPLGAAPADAARPPAGPGVGRPLCAISW